VYLRIESGGSACLAAKPIALNSLFGTSSVQFWLWWVFSLSPMWHILTIHQAVVLYSSFVASKYPDSSHHRFLCSLDLRFALRVDGFGLPSWLPVFFLNIQSPNCLEEILMMVTIATFTSKYVEPPSWWRDIDSLLTWPQFSCLHKVHLIFALTPDNTTDNHVMPLIVHVSRSDFFTWSFTWSVPSWPITWRTFGHQELYFES
jgi:hypothetical protein